MPPNPVDFNGKRPDDNSFVNIAFSAGETRQAMTAPSTPTTVVGLTNNNVLTNRRGSSDAKSQSDKGRAAAGDANNNSNTNGNGGVKALVACGSAAEESLMDFDDLLPYVGEFGRYQKILFLLMIPFAFFVAWTYFSQIFLTLVPQEYHCALPELDVLQLSPEDR